MSTFDPKSRYVRHAATYTTLDRKGRPVLALTPARKPAEVELGVHRRIEGQRLDHLAYYYLSDAHGYWRICELNDVLLPDALAEADEIRIPTRLG